MSIEQMVRSRVRTFLRHTWLVTVLGSLVLIGAIWYAIYITTAPTVMRIAAGPPGSIDLKFAQALRQKFAEEHDAIRLDLVTTDGPQESADAVKKGKAELAILPSTIGNSPLSPAVAIVRRNVMALIVPASPPAPPAPVAQPQTPAPVLSVPPQVAAPAEPGTPPLAAAKKEANAEKPAKGKKETKESKRSKGGSKSAKHEKADKKEKSASNESAKTAKTEDSDDTDDDASPVADAASSKAADAPKTPDKTSDSTKTEDAAKSQRTDSGKAAAANNKLEKVAQLADHRVGIVTGDGATRELLDVVLKHYGVPLDGVQASLVEPKDLADAVKTDQVDVFFVVGSATGRAMTDAVAAASRNGAAPSFIAIDQADGIAKRNPDLDSVDIDAGTFGGVPPSPDDSLKSLGFDEYLVAQKSFNHDNVASLARLIYSSRQALAAAMPGEIKIEAPSTDKDASVMVHPGALAYLSDDQKSFFDKYGDDIFYGLLIFPIFGSAIAGVAGYFRNSGRTRRLRLLQQLLELVRKAHTAPTLEALDQMQLDVDNLVIAIVHQSEREEYDESAQASFRIALDQVRFAIATRRAALEGGATDAKPSSKAAAAYSVAR